MKKALLVLLVLSWVTQFGCRNRPTKELTVENLKDKIAGGWAGKMIGVSYGAKSEFSNRGKINNDSIVVSKVNNSLGQDDIYVQLTFMETMDKYGIDAPLKKYQEGLANAGYMLWHANLQARKNYIDSIFPPQSGMPQYNIHADDIDFQIESDYIGFMNPGMPNSACKRASEIGQIMNYGDGIYGGLFLDALYANAFLENDIEKIVNKALLSIPTQSEYALIVKDVITLHQHNPNDWKATWNEIQNKWGETDICGSGDPINIDAKLNGAYVIIGLLYGDGDIDKTMEITVRCGQDSDCNPSNALAILGIIKGFNNFPSTLRNEVSTIADSLFKFTTYTFNKAVDNTLKYALKNIKLNNGKADGEKVTIEIQDPVAPALSESFPKMVLDQQIAVFDSAKWVKKGDWKNYYINLWWVKIPFKQAIYAENKGDEISIDFDGTAVCLMGNWLKNGGKADIYLDGTFNRTINTWYLCGFQEEANMSLFHQFNLKPGKHNLRLVVKGEKYEKSSGNGIYITELRVFKTTSKKNEGYKFSFEK